MRITADDLLEFGVIDDIVPEKKGGAAKNVEACAEYMIELIRKDLEVLTSEDKMSLIDKRYEKFRKF